jgi:16S rRNA (cytosine1402-N4)-methyltransferase
MYHQPVLLEESISGLNIDPNGIYVDATFGGGGHSKEIYRKLNKGKLIAFDQDKDAENNVGEDEKIIFVRHNFRYMKNFLKYLGFTQINGILADLGVSSHHFNTPDRGFSFRFSAPLDMRMNQNHSLTARYIINRYHPANLFKIFKEYGEIKSPRRIVDTIIKEREKKEINTTDELTYILDPLIPERSRNKMLARIFQALRIEVNQEIANLKIFLSQSAEMLKDRGRLVVISYHSLEDRLVKNFMKTGRFSGTPEKDFYGNILKPLKTINSKVITPSEKEISENNRARSAKLRIAEKTQQ